MAKATATCRCAACGKQFVVSKDCFSRSDADGWSAWASEHMTECPDCRRLRVKFDAAAKAAPIVWECELPEITGASDKQIAYARDLRSRYLADKGEALNPLISIIIFVVFAIKMLKNAWKNEGIVESRHDGKYLIRILFDSFCFYNT